MKMEEGVGREQKWKSLAAEAYNLWDSDQDSKCGKLLRAMMGGLPGYRSDVDALLAASIPEAPIPGVAERGDALFRVVGNLLICNRCGCAAPRHLAECPLYHPEVRARTT